MGLTPPGESVSPSLRDDRFPFPSRWLAFRGLSTYPVATSAGEISSIGMFFISTWNAALTISRPSAVSVHGVPPASSTLHEGLTSPPDSESSE